MTRPKAFALAGLSLAIGGAVGTAVVRLVDPAPFIGGFGFNGATMVGYLIQGLTWALVGALLVVRRPDNTVGWLMVLVGVGYAVSQLSVSLTFGFAADGNAEGDRLAQLAGWVTVLLQLVTILHFAIGFIFPTGRPQNRRWARFMRAFWAFAVVFLAASLTQPGPLQLIPGLDNPFGFGPDLRGGRPIAPILSLAAVMIFVSLLISMVSRYRLAGLIERQQQKWFVLALGVSSIGLGVLTFEAIFSNGPASAMGLTVYVFSGALVPIAIGIAILRYRLYAIDRIVSRGIGYGVVTAVLGGAFAAAALTLGTVLGTQGDNQTIQVAGATLLVAALFGRVRARVQAVVDRRFDRFHFDATRTIDALTARLRDDVDLVNLESNVLAVVGETFHPERASVWLRQPQTSRSDHPVTIPGHRLATMAPR